jgi:hypothetical protein
MTEGCGRDLAAAYGYADRNLSRALSEQQIALQFL